MRDHKWYHLPTMTIIITHTHTHTHRYTQLLLFFSVLYFFINETNSTISWWLRVCKDDCNDNTKKTRKIIIIIIKPAHWLLGLFQVVCSNFLKKTKYYDDDDEKLRQLKDIKWFLVFYSLNYEQKSRRRTFLEMVFCSFYFYFFFSRTIPVGRLCWI